MLRREIQISQAPLANDPSTDTPRVPRCFRSEERLSARCAELCRPSIRPGEVAWTRSQVGREGRVEEGGHKTPRSESSRSLRLARYWKTASRVNLALFQAIRFAAPQRADPSSGGKQPPAGRPEGGRPKGEPNSRQPSDETTSPSGPSSGLSALGRHKVVRDARSAIGACRSP